MTRSELIERLASSQKLLSVKDIELSVKAILDAMTETLSQRQRIEIRGFGSFTLHEREARVGRNPRTGEPVSLPARVAPHFKPGKALRDRVNASAAHIPLVEDER